MWSSMSPTTESGIVSSSVSDEDDYDDVEVTSSDLCGGVVVQKDVIDPKPLLLL